MDPAEAVFPGAPGAADSPADPVVEASPVAPAEAGASPEAAPGAADSAGDRQTKTPSLAAQCH